MQIEGLTPFALGFMLVSMGAVTILMAYCYYRILSSPGSAEHPAAPDLGSEEGTPPGGDGGSRG